MATNKTACLQTAVRLINENGMLLVFPINNRPIPPSLWSRFYPRSKMRWEWNDDGDDRVAQLWGLMKRLSDCRQVVYSKWYQGRATFFSRNLFTAMLATQMKTRNIKADLSFHAIPLLEALEEDSPLSTKELKRLTELQGKFNEPNYNRGMKLLFQRLLVVGFGEVDDGAFPSLAVGATRMLYEDLWEEAKAMTSKDAQYLIDRHLIPGSPMRRFFDKTLAVE